MTRRQRLLFIPILLSLSSTAETASLINNTPHTTAFVFPSIFSGPITFQSKSIQYYSTTRTTLQARGKNKNKNKKGGTSSSQQKMPRGVKKENLPSKVCVVCNRPFTWRKKWERCWDEVSTCSKSCNHKRREGARKENNSNDDNDNNVEIIETTSFTTMANILETSDEELLTMTRKTAKASSSSPPTATVNENLNVLEDIEGATNELLQMTLEKEEIEVESMGSGNGDDDENDTNQEEIILDDPVALRKAQRKAEKKAKKAARRAQREGRGDPTAGQKQCDMCDKSVDLLVRCMYEPSQTEWKMICGKCWKVASGGVVDGDDAHPHYRYGGLWKNRRKR